MFNFFLEKKPFDAHVALHRLLLARTVDARIAILNAMDINDLPPLSKELEFEYRLSVDTFKQAIKSVSPMFNHPIDEATIENRCLKLIYRLEAPVFRKPDYKPSAEEYDVKPLHWDNFRQQAQVIATNFNLQMQYADCKQLMLAALLQRETYFFTSTSWNCALL